MADIGQYNDSTRPDKCEHSGNWRAVGDLARKLVLDMAERKAKEAEEARK